MTSCRWWFVQLLSSLCFHLFVVLSSCRFISTDLNGPQAAGLNTEVEWQAGGGAIHLAAPSATLTASGGNDSTSINCLAVVSSHAFIEQEVRVNLSAASALLLNSTANSTLHICHMNASNSNSLQLFADVVRRMTFDCWIDCTFSSYRTFHFFVVYGNGSKIATSSTSQVWMTSQPELDFVDGPIVVSFSPGSSPVALFSNSTIAVRANRRTGLQSAHLTLLNNLDAPSESLTVNTTNTNTSLTNDNETTTLSIVFPLNITDDNVVSTLRLITYHNNNSHLHCGPRHIEVIISNGLLFSNPLTVTVNIVLVDVNNTPLEIIGCFNNNTELTATLTTGTIIAIGASAGTVVVLFILVVAIICVLKRHRTNFLKVDGRKRQRFTYSQYLGDHDGLASRKSSRKLKSYSFQQPPPCHNHLDLKKDSRAAVRRLSLAFEENGMGSVFGSNPGSLHEMTTAGLFRPRSGTDTSQLFRTGTVLPGVDENPPSVTISDGFTADDILETQEYENKEEEDIDAATVHHSIFRPRSGTDASQLFRTGTVLPGIDENPSPFTISDGFTASDILGTQEHENKEEEDIDAAIDSSFMDIFENSGQSFDEEKSVHLPGQVDGDGNEDDVIWKSKNPQPRDEPTNEGLLTPGQIRARNQAITMLSNFYWPDEASDSSDIDMN